MLISKFGWQWVFYLFGASALLWLPFWLPLHVQKDLLAGTVAAGAASSGPAGVISSTGSASAKALLQQQQQQPDRDSLQTSLTAGSDEDQPLLMPRSSLEIEQQSSTTADPAAPQGPLGGQLAAAGGSNGSSTGFRALMQRREVWAICACQYAQSYGMYGLLTWLPTFFTDFYGVKLVDLGGYTLLPYVLQVTGE